MEFAEVVRRRRMIRRFDRRPVPTDVMDRILEAGRRAPSAGFSQGLELMVLDTPETIAEFWAITRDDEFPWEDEDIAVGPTVLVLPLPDKARYIARYSEDDKIAFGMDEEERLGGWYVGITHGERALLDRFGVPADLRPIGIIGFGYRADDEEPQGSWTKRRRRPFEEQVHRNGW